MERISAEAYAALIQAGEVLSRDGYGEKVVLCTDGRLIKTFRLKRPWSAGRLKPYALRFARNAEKLHELGIATVSVERVAYCPEHKRHLVCYQPLPGTTLRDIQQVAEPAEAVARLLDFAVFLALLHNRGIYFRSIHFGNVVYSESGAPGLIDIADMRFRRGPLGPVMRVRNFKHMARYDIDQRALAACGPTRFLDAYLSHAKLSRQAEGRFLRQLQQDLPLFAPGPSGG